MARRPKISPYPARGTEFGDQHVGPCTGADCGRELRRGDSFVVRLDGALLCIFCKENLTDHKESAS
jgi:hypothetical protein